MRRVATAIGPVVVVQTDDCVVLAAHKTTFTTRCAQPNIISDQYSEWVIACGNEALRNGSSSAVAINLRTKKTIIYNDIKLISLARDVFIYYHEQTKALYEINLTSSKESMSIFKTQSAVFSFNGKPQLAFDTPDGALLYSLYRHTTHLVALQEGDKVTSADLLEDNGETWLVVGCIDAKGKNFFKWKGKDIPGRITMIGKSHIVVLCDETGKRKIMNATSVEYICPMDLVLEQEDGSILVVKTVDESHVF